MRHKLNTFRVGQCKKCNEHIEFHTTMGRPKELCDKCIYELKKKTSKEYRKKIRSLGLDCRSSRKKARKYGGHYDASLKALDIFERANWACQRCGIDTPKENRGKGLSNSPELDHIVPLSKGGDHAMHNVQCLCRKCNIDKGDKIYW